MRRLRRLPPLLRVAGILGLLLPVSAIVVISAARFSPLSQSYREAARGIVIAAPQKRGSPVTSPTSMRPDV